MSLTCTSPVILEGQSVSEITANVADGDGAPLQNILVTFNCYPSQYPGFATSGGALLSSPYSFSANTDASGEAEAYFRPTRWGRTYIMAETNTGLSEQTYFDAEYQPTAPPDFCIDVSPRTRNVGRSDSTTYEVTVVPENGFFGIMTLSAENLPGDVSISSETVLPDEPTTMNVTVGPSAPYGTHTFEFVADCGEFSRSEEAVLVIKQGTIEWIWPNGGETVYSTDTYTVQWNYTGSGSVDVDVSYDGGSSWFTYKTSCV